MPVIPAPEVLPSAVRRGTSEQWRNGDLILRLGEVGRDTDLSIVKYGDGVHHWNELPTAYATYSQIVALVQAMLSGLGNSSGDATVPADDDWPDLVVLAEAASI